MSRNHQPTRDLLEIIDRHLSRGNPNYQADLEEARISAAIAREAYDMRQEAGLARHELARKLGVTTAEIRNLEEDDFHGNALVMLQRIATVLGRTVEIRILPRTSRKKPA